MAGLFGPSHTVTPDFFWAVAIGRVKGVSAVDIVGKANLIGLTDPPLTIGFGNKLQGFATTGEAWEIVSSSANDSAAGTGARTVSITSLNANYVSRTETITMNGVTAVPLTIDSSYFRHQVSVVATAGSGSVNAGDITIRVSGGGASRGVIAAGDGYSRQASFTVPANNVLHVIDTIIFQALAAGTPATANIASIVHLPSGINVLGFDFTQNVASAPIHADCGIAIQEKTTLEYRVQSVSSANLNVALITVGLLADLTQIQFGLPS